MNWLRCHYWFQVPQYGWQRGESHCSPSDRNSGHDSSSSTNIRKETVIHRTFGQQPAPRRDGVSIATNTNTHSVKEHNTAITACTISLPVLYPSDPKSSFESFLSSLHRPFTAHKNSNISIFLCMTSSIRVAEIANLEQHSSAVT